MATRQDEFDSWFGRSVVTDKAGKPMCVAHATDDPTFVPSLRYGMGPHFSDGETASTRLAQRMEDGDKIEEASLYRAYLRIERPLRMRDVHFDELCTFIEGVLETGVINESAVRGFDGIAYENYIEGGGSLTWIPFTLEQIREAPESPPASGSAKPRRTIPPSGWNPPGHRAAPR
jgi:hypothetical protein